MQTSNQTLESAKVGVGSSPALLVVDASKGFTDPDSPLGANYDNEIFQIERIRKHAQEKNWTCFFSTVVYHNQHQASVFRKKIPALNVLTPQSQWVEIDRRISLKESDILFEKQFASCFHGTDFYEQLTNINIDTLIITGFTTSGCVRATVVDALQHNLNVLVVKDAVGDRDSIAHMANIKDMDTKYADVVDTDFILNL